MTYYVFIDDKRPLPNETEQYDVSVLIRDFGDAILFLEKIRYEDIYLSLDFDLSDKDGFTGIDLLRNILLHRDRDNWFKSLKVHCHSDLPARYDNFSAIIKFNELPTF